MLAKRRVIGKAHKAITPLDVLERIHRRNLADYGDELGPTIEWFRSKGKSWEDIIESASRPGGADLGFSELRMVWLQRKERYDTFAEFDSISGILREFRRSFWRKPPRSTRCIILHNDEEVTAVGKVAGLLMSLLNRYGKSLRDEEYLTKPEWGEIVQVAAAALKVMRLH